VEQLAAAGLQGVVGLLVAGDGDGALELVSRRVASDTRVIAS